VRRALKAGNLSAAEALERLERSSEWGWTALAPESKLLLGIAGGSRPLAMPQRVVPPRVQRLASDGMPRLLPDGFQESATAWLRPSGQWRPPERRPEQGPRPTPRGRPRPALL